MHLRGRAEAALALLAATVALAAALSPTYPTSTPGNYPAETPVWADEWQEVVEDVVVTEVSDVWVTEGTESPHTIHRQYSPPCPPVHVNSSLSCVDSLWCEYDESCPEDKICCPNDCGGMECKYPLIKGPPPPIDEEVVDDVVTTEPTEEWTTAGTESPHTTRRQYSPMCPPVHLNLSLFCDDIISCGDNGSCIEPQICCLNDCGEEECTYPHIMGTLPPIEEVVDDVVTTESTKEMVTAGTESPRTTRRQYSPMCPPVHLNLSLSCDDIIWCDDNGSCIEPQICCLNDCGEEECIYPHIMGAHPPIEEMKMLEPDYEFAEVPTPEEEEEEESPAVGYAPLIEWLYPESLLCPALDSRGPGPCGKACSSWDNACSEGRVCCRNNCGFRECMDAVRKEQPALKEKERYFWELYAENTIHQYQKNDDK